MAIRLNKVTRDLNVGITTVVEFLQKKGHTIEASPNAKITEEQYAELVKEFSKDKNLKKESEKFIQERQNKERNKPTVSIEEEPKKEEEIDLRPSVKFKPVGKIDLDSLNKRTTSPKVEESVKEEEPEILEQSYDMDCLMRLRIRRSMMPKLRARLEKVESLRFIEEEEVQEDI